MSETRLDRLWQGVSAAPEDDAAWTAFYEGLAAARLVIALEGEAAESLRPTILDFGEGRAALAFDTDDRFAEAIGKPTDYAALSGVELARLLAGEGVSLALNPGVAASETVLGPDQLAWVAETFGAAMAPAAEEAAPVGGKVMAPEAPEETLLAALGARIADFGPAIAEGWLVMLDHAGRRRELLLVVRLGDRGRALGPEVAQALTRAGQIASSTPFAVAVAEEGERLLTAARSLGVGFSPAD